MELECHIIRWIVSNLTLHFGVFDIRPYWETRLVLEDKEASGGVPLYLFTNIILVMSNRQ